MGGGFVVVVFFYSLFPLRKSRPSHFLHACHALPSTRLKDTNEHLPPEPFKFNLPCLLRSFNLVFRSRGSNVKWVNFSMFFLLHW